LHHPDLMAGMVSTRSVLLDKSFFLKEELNGKEQV